MAKAGNKTKDNLANEPANVEARVAPARRRWKLGLLAALLLMAGTVWLAPIIVGYTALRDWALNAAVPVKGRITSGAASLGWFSPVVIENLELFDVGGSPVAKIDLVASEKSLASLALNHSEVGKISVE